MHVFRQVKILIKILKFFLEKSVKIPVVVVVAVDVVVVGVVVVVVVAAMIFAKLVFYSCLQVKNSLKIWFT